MNCAVMTGYVTADPISNTVKVADKDVNVTNFTIAVRDSFGENAKPEFIRVTAWRGLGESFPARVCLKVSTPQDSYALLNQKGGESLPRKGSMYYLDGIDPDPQYLQCGFITPREVRSVIDALKSNYVNIRKRSIFEEIEDDDPEGGPDDAGRKKFKLPF